MLDTYAKTGKPAEARKLIDELLIYADSEPFLVKGYEGMQTCEKAIPPQASTRIPEALDRLIELYTATNKPDEVRKHTEMRAKYPTQKETASMPREVK